SLLESGHPADLATVTLNKSIGSSGRRIDRRRGPPLALRLAMTMGKSIGVALALFALLHATRAAAAQPTTGTIVGTVSIAGADGQPLVMPGVTVTLTCGASEPKIDVSNDRGEFRFADTPMGECSVVADLQGFKSAVKTVTVNRGEEASAPPPP